MNFIIMHLHLSKILVTKYNHLWGIRIIIYNMVIRSSDIIQFISSIIIIQYTDTLREVDFDSQNKFVCVKKDICSIGDWNQANLSRDFINQICFMSFNSSIDNWFYKNFVFAILIKESFPVLVVEIKLI